MMNDLRGIMSGIYTKAEDWGYWPEGRRNPMSRVKIGEKWSVRPERILNEDETVRVLARLSDPNLLVVETALATGARISELLGLKWKHIDLKSGVIQIVQRNWRGDIDDPKSKTSKRPLTLGYLVDRYSAKATADKASSEMWVFARTDGSGLPALGFRGAASPETGGGRRGLRFRRAGSALLPPRQYHLAAGSWRFEYRGVEDRRTQHGPNDRGIHEDPTHPPGRTHPPDSGSAGGRGRQTLGRRQWRQRGPRVACHEVRRPGLHHRRNPDHPVGFQATLPLCRAGNIDLRKCLRAPHRGRGRAESIGGQTRQNLDSSQWPLINVVVQEVGQPSRVRLSKLFVLNISKHVGEAALPGRGLTCCYFHSMRKCPS